MVWLEFLLCALLIWAAGSQLCRYGEAIAERSGSSRTWIGVVLLASATSLPELVAGVSAAGFAGMPDIAIGDVLDLTPKMAADGKLDWDAPAGSWIVYRFCHASTGRPPHPVPDDVLGKVFAHDIGALGVGFDTPRAKELFETLARELPFDPRA